MTAYATVDELAAFAGFLPTYVTATATATLVGDAVTALTLGAGGGYGYVSNPPVLIEAPPTGVRATAGALVANGVVTTLTLLHGGSGYVTTPAVTIGPPEDLSRILERASELIDDYLRTAVYDVDDDGMPTDADTIAVLRDATCAQVELWLAGDEEDDILGPVDKLSLGGMTVENSASQGQRVAPYALAPRAARILRNAGLYSTDPVIL